MILIYLPIALQLLSTGCNNEPEYDLSKIPIDDAPAQPAQDTPPPPPEDQPTADAPEEAFEIANNDCVPPLDQEPVLTEANSITVSVSLGPKVLGYDLMIDLIQSEHGELQYGVVCKGTNFSFKAPKMLGTVRAAVFIDADHNGPSAEDVQGVTETFTITDKSVTIPTVAWSDGPLSYYSFDGKEDNPDNPPSETPTGDAE